MKRMKWVVTICMVIGITTTTYAQQTQPTPAQIAKNMQTQLQLSDAQTAKVTAVYQQIEKEKASDKATQAQVKNWTATQNRPALAAYMLKRINIVEARIVPILTPQQKNTYEQMLSKVRNTLQKTAATK